MFLTILAPLKSWDSQLSNGTKINKNGYQQQKLWTYQVMNIPGYDAILAFWYDATKTFGTMEGTIVPTWTRGGGGGIKPYCEILHKSIKTLL